MTPLVALRCEACGALALPPALACHRCGNAAFASVEIAPTGVIHATTAIRVPMPDPSGELPAVAPIAVVALDDGPLVVARLDAALADTLPEIGTRVRVDVADGGLRVAV